MSAIVATAMTGEPTDEELAAVVAALNAARRRVRVAASGSRWARAGRMEAIGTPLAGIAAAGLTGWAAAERPR